MVKLDSMLIAKTKAMKTNLPLIASKILQKVNDLVSKHPIISFISVILPTLIILRTSLKFFFPIQTNSGHNNKKNKRTSNKKKTKMRLLTMTIFTLINPKITILLKSLRKL
jgi:arginine exporter protein ArgO